MKLNIKSLSAVALFAAAAFSAQAQSFVTNDILVGFRSGSLANDLEINTGNLSTLTTFSTTTLIGNFNASLTSAFGASWATVGGTSWSAAGTDNASNLDYASVKWGAAAGILGTPNTNIATAFTSATFSSSSLGNASAAILVAGQGYTGGTSSAAADAGARTIGKADPLSWTTNQTTGAAAWGVFNANATYNNTTNRVNTSVTASVIDLYKMAPDASGQFLGSFSLKSNGDLFFTAAAIPEPSTYAAILGAAVLGLVMLRRRSQTAIV